MKVETHKLFGRTFQLWYDRSVRVWYVAEVLNAEGDIARASDFFNRDSALMWIGVLAHQPREV